MVTRTFIALLAAVPMLAASLNAQSVPEVGQGPPTRRDSRWRIQQERSDYMHDLWREVDYLRRHQSRAEYVPFVPRVAQRGLQSFAGEDTNRTGPPANGSCCSPNGYGGISPLGGAVPYWYPYGPINPYWFGYGALNPYWPMYPFLPLYLRPELVYPQRHAEHGLVQLGKAENPNQATSGLSLTDQLPLLMALAHGYEPPRAQREEAEYEAPARPRSLPGANTTQAPDYCYSGDGHPLGGREWCHRRGYPVGAGWVRESGRDFVMERPMAPINRAALAASIGSDLALELDVQRARFGFSEPLAGSYVATLEYGNVLRVRSGRLQVAEIVDRDRDGRVDAIWRRTDR